MNSQVGPPNRIMSQAQQKGDPGGMSFDARKPREHFRLMSFKNENLPSGRHSADDPSMRSKTDPTSDSSKRQMVHGHKALGPGENARFDDKDREYLSYIIKEKRRDLFPVPVSNIMRNRIDSIERPFLRGSDGAITGSDRKARDSNSEPQKYPLKIAKERKPSGNLTGYVKPAKGRERGVSDPLRRSRIIERPPKEEQIDTSDGTHRPKHQLFVTTLDDPARQMKGAYSQLTMDERIRALSLLKKHGLFPTALKLDKLPKPIGEEKGVAPTKDILDENSVFEIVKSVVDKPPSKDDEEGRGKLSIDVPPGSVGAVYPPGTKPPAPTPVDRDRDKRYKPPGTVEPKGVIPICDEFRPCVKTEPCETKPLVKDLSKELSPSQMEAHNYLSKKRIFEFFQFMICHLLAEQPDDPVAYLGNLLDRCMMFRSGFSDPPLLFTEKHVNSVYHAMDPDEKGYITRKQFETAMKTMSVSNYSEPEMDENGFISKEDFVNETVRALTENLNEMLKVGEVEPWRFLDKWFIPTAKIKQGKAKGVEGSARGGSSPKGVYRPPGIVGASGRLSMVGQNIPQPPAVGGSQRRAPSVVNALARFGPGSVLQSVVSTMRPPLDQPSSRRESVVGRPAQYKSVRQDDKEHAHMHDSPTND